MAACPVSQDRHRGKDLVTSVSALSVPFYTRFTSVFQLMRLSFYAKLIPPSLPPSTTVPTHCLSPQPNITPPHFFPPPE
ncbi:hypothetical protein CesoFtcFv8_002654 [Champsocephalus esox]|uniref:Uncharacterized protein n=1 Tax=Champsocephalus esox TaxID=159716 RepID=A0AAN8HEM8_9TELE|nr:hypothetical protein CesoFtcFv8_002654 [Champsocephalus esox]